MHLIDNQLNLEDNISKKTSQSQIFEKQTENLITNSQQAFSVTQSTENEPSDSRGIALLNILTDNKIWNYALKDLNAEFQNARLDSQLLQTYTINYYYKKVKTKNRFCITK